MCYCTFCRYLKKCQITVIAQLFFWIEWMCENVQKSVNFKITLICTLKRAIIENVWLPFSHICPFQKSNCAIFLQCEESAILKFALFLHIFTHLLISKEWLYNFPFLWLFLKVQMCNHTFLSLFKKVRMCNHTFCRSLKISNCAIALFVTLWKCAIVQCVTKCAIAQLHIF